MRARAAVNFLMYFKTLSTKHFKQTASPGLRSSALVALVPCQVDFLREAAKFSPLRSCRQNPTEAEIKYFILDSTAVRAVQQLNGKVFQLSSGQPSQHQAGDTLPCCLRNTIVHSNFHLKTNELISVGRTKQGETIVIKWLWLKYYNSGEFLSRIFHACPQKGNSSFVESWLPWIQWSIRAVDQSSSINVVITMPGIRKSSWTVFDHPPTDGFPFPPSVSCQPAELSWVFQQVLLYRKYINSIFHFRGLRGAPVSVSMFVLCA